ncbi:amidohydrolase [Purpureocillium lavendulum]|uniref:Amidohydrolase n=1 Tax=Purpureocillium lavendulum TaxID=1247861 RepID=A0AB34FEF8_9HYPO|nr:amidohydrolase [Purpureocillium lavendulum]
MASQGEQQSASVGPWVNGRPPSSESMQEPELQQIRLRYRLSPPTFGILCTIGKSPDRREVLHRACLATELRSFPLRQAERGFFREINDHLPIPYPVKENVSEPWHKAFLLVQIQLQRMPWPNKLPANVRKELHCEEKRIGKVLEAGLRCLVDILGLRRDGRGLSVALDVLRSVKASVWEGSDNEILQLEGLGLRSREKLAAAKIKTVKQLAKLEFWHIERLLSRNPPFGQHMLRQLAAFPVLTLQFDIVRQCSASHPTGVTVTPSSAVCSWIARATVDYENEASPLWAKSTPWTTLVIEGDDGRLVWFWRGSVKRLAGGKELILRLDARKGEELKITFACENVVGTMVRITHQV